MSQPCRFCLTQAYESICLDCRSKFEALKRDNEWLRKQLEIYRKRETARYREIKSRIQRRRK